MLLSGGTTPGPLYERLSKQNFSWDKVWFAPTDERWVEPTHTDSNEKLIRNTLLKNEASGAHYIGLKSAGDDPVFGQKETELKLRQLPLPIDVVLLGMGEDGHIASLFPGLADTQNAMSETNKQLCHPVRRGDNDVNRMTMTLNVFLGAKQICLLFFGEKKLEVLENAVQEKTELLPVSFLIHQNQVPVSLYWAE